MKKCGPPDVEVEWGREKMRAGVWKSAMKLGQIQGFQKMMREVTGGGLEVSDGKKGTMPLLDYNSIY